MTLGGSNSIAAPSPTVIAREAKLDRIRDLAATGLTAREIAQALHDGSSKGSVIGLCGRNKIDLSRSRGPLGKRAKPVVKTRAPRAIVKPPAVSVTRVVPLIERAPGEPFVWPFDGELSAAARAVIGLERGDCRFPLGDVGDPAFRFCAAPAVEAGPYCEAHDRLAFNPGLPRSVKWRPDYV